MNKFRKLNADEIECRISIVKEKSVTLLLYKDARCDMNILDETVGPENWERRHKGIDGRLYCVVSIYSEDHSRWIDKEDVGTESYTEKEKGQASDSFKRACVNWGIGRELYTAPRITISNGCCNIKQSQNKFVCYDKFYVSKIAYDDKGSICDLVIRDQNSNKEVYKMNEKVEIVFVTENHIKTLRKEIERTGAFEKAVLYQYSLKKIEDMTMEQFKHAMDIFIEMEDKPVPTPEEKVVEAIPDEDHFK